MNPEDLTKARAILGKMWGFKRDVSCAELGRALRLKGKNPGESIRDYERGTTKISGPVSVAVDMMLAGMIPPDDLDEIRTQHRDPPAD